MSYRSAKRLYKVMGTLSEFLDEWMTWGASFLGMCGEGKNNNWSILFARIFYTECPCCNFYRGVTVGVVLTLFLTITVIGVLHYGLQLW